MEADIDEITMQMATTDSAGMARLPYVPSYQDPLELDRIIGLAQHAQRVANDAPHTYSQPDAVLSLSVAVTNLAGCVLSITQYLQAAERGPQ